MRIGNIVWAIKETSLNVSCVYVRARARVCVRVLS